MDDIGNLLYIVFIIISFLSWAFKKKTPKNQPKPNENGEINIPEDSSTGKRDRQLTFEELLREFTEEKIDEPQVKDDPQEEQKQEARYDDDDISKKYQESINQAKSLETIHASESFLKRERPEYGEFDAYSIEEETTYGDVIRESLKNPEDIKKAIILKEVLDRKF